MYDDNEHLSTVEFICRSCFLVANRFTSPDGVRCSECAEYNRAVYDGE